MAHQTKALTAVTTQNPPSARIDFRNIPRRDWECSLDDCMIVKLFTDAKRFPVDEEWRFDENQKLFIKATREAVSEVSAQVGYLILYKGFVLSQDDNKLTGECGLLLELAPFSLPGRSPNAFRRSFRVALEECLAAKRVRSEIKVNGVRREVNLVKEWRRFRDVTG